MERTHLLRHDARRGVGRLVLGAALVVVKGLVELRAPRVGGAVDVCELLLHADGVGE